MTRMLRPRRVVRPSSPASSRPLAKVQQPMTRRLSASLYDVVVHPEESRSPRLEGALATDAGGDERHSGVEGADDAYLPLGRLRGWSSAGSEHHVEPHIERARPSPDEGVAGKGGLPRLVTSEDPLPCSDERPSRLICRPVVGPDDEHGRRAGPQRRRSLARRLDPSVAVRHGHSVGWPPGRCQRRAINICPTWTLLPPYGCAGCCHRHPPGRKCRSKRADGGE